MEPNEISDETIYYEVYIRFGHGRVHRQGRWRRGSRRVVCERTSTVGVGERELGKVPHDVMRGRVRPDHVLETAGGDLVVVVGVTPSTDVGRGVTEEGGFIEAGGIWIKIVTMSSGMDAQQQ